MGEGGPAVVGAEGWYTAGWKRGRLPRWKGEEAELLLLLLLLLADGRGRWRAEADVEDMALAAAAPDEDGELGRSGGDMGELDGGGRIPDDAPRLERWPVTIVVLSGGLSFDFQIVRCGTIWGYCVLESTSRAAGGGAIGAS